MSSASPGRSDVRSTQSRVVRFDRVERALHWSTAGLFLVLIATALPLYFPQIESVVGRRALLAHVHLWTGIALPVPFVIAVAGPWGRGFVAICAASTCGPTTRSAGCGPWAVGRSTSPTSSTPARS